MIVRVLFQQGDEFALDFTVFSEVSHDRVHGADNRRVSPSILGMLQRKE